MTSFGSVGQAAQAVSVAQGKALPGLAEKWKAALQQKEPRELGSILAEVRGLGVKGEKAFLATVVKKDETAVSGSASTLGESLSASLSLEQRAEVAKELFSIKGFKGHFFSKASLESKLAKYLAQMGKEKAGWAATRDEMVREGGRVRAGLGQGGASIFDQMPGVPKQTPTTPGLEREVPTGHYDPPMDCMPDPVRLEELRQQLEKKARDL